MSYRNDVNEGLKEARWTLGRIVLFIILPLIGLSILGGIASWGFGIMSQPGKILEKSLDADKVISDHEWFKQTYRDVLATEMKIANAQEDVRAFNESAGTRDKWTFEDKTESSRLSSVLTGLKNYRQDLVAQYNARSKMLTRKFFMGLDVPPELN